MPPPTAPTISPACCPLVGPEPGVVDRLTRRLQRQPIGRDRRAEPGSGSGTSAAMRQRKPPTSINVTGRIAQTPLRTPSQYALTPGPKGLTAPSPVTTTRFMPAWPAP